MPIISGLLLPNTFATEIIDFFIFLVSFLELEIWGWSTMCQLPKNKFPNFIPVDLFERLEKEALKPKSKLFFFP